MEKNDIEEQNYKEKLLTKYPLFASIECTETILSQMKNNICKIKTKKANGTGFFSYISIPHSNEKLTVFITNNHVIDKEILQQGNPIMLTLNDDYNNPKNKYLELNDRKVYTSEKYDITIIQIIPDIDGINNFLEIDKQIFEENYICNKDSIYIIQNPLILNKQKAVVSYGITKNLEKYEINYWCNTDYGSSGSPILCLSNNKVIGVHKQASKYNFEFNQGTFLKEPINEYLNGKNIIKIENKKYGININNNIINEIKNPMIDIKFNKMENLNIKNINNPQVIQNYEDKDEKWNILFKKLKKITIIRINPEKTIKELIDLYKNTTKQNDELKFLYNCNYLEKSIKISNSDLCNNCTIDVV